MTMEGLESLFAGMVALIIIFVILVIAIYVALATFLNKFNKLLYGKGSACAWFPIANAYLLGKLTFNKTVGWIMVALTFLCSSTTTTVNGVETTYNPILPGWILSFAWVGLLIYAIIKYNQLKRGEISVEIAAAQSNSFSFSKPASINPAPVNSQPVGGQSSSTQTPPTVPTNPPATGNKFCPNCGAQLTEDSTFCTNCGQQVQ